jgi:hypothetical protein
MNGEFGGATERSARVTLIRDAAIYTPLSIAGVVLTVLSAIGVINAGGVLTVIEALLTLLFIYQATQALRDLRSPLLRTEGVVTRRWSRMDFFVTRSHYIAIGRKIFNLPAADWYQVEENAQIALLHYPHTGTVARVERIPKPPAER